MTAIEAICDLNKSERLRNLEILKYGTSVRINYEGDADSASDSSSLRLADDAVLTALCQLAALRLDCARGFFCLNDSQKQHIVAESSRTLSPYDVAIHAPGDELAFGVTSFSVDFGITQMTMDAYTRGSQHFVESQSVSINQQRSVFLDLENEPFLASVPFIQSNTIYRCYAEVPVKNARGVVIGILAVLDNRPRASFAELDIRPMLDIAQIIMEHLELVRLKDINAHAERLLQGLAHFNAGQSSIDEWARSHPGQPESEGPLSTDTEVMRGPLRSTVMYSSQDDGSTALSATTSSERPDYDVRNSAATTNLDSLTTLSSLEDTNLQEKHDLSEGSIVRKSTPVPAQSFDTVAASTSVRRPSSKKNAEPTRILFTRAANLIREAMDLDSTCFIELPANSRFNVAGLKDRRKQTQEHNDSAADTPGAESAELSTTTNSDHEARSSLSESQTNNNAEETSDSVYCECTAFSTKDMPGLVANVTTSAYARMSARTLSNLALAYPMGHIFHFDAQGPITSGDEQHPDQVKFTHRSRRATVAKVLSKTFPRARSLLFIPFHDNERRKMYTAFFGWLEGQSRVLQDSDLVYITGFAHSVMCEILRLETLAVEKAKSVFMSSISHELRSPLHGILAATELLRESHLTSEQIELTLMTDSCGRTLLDIMNNLLEHAKINNMVNHSDRRKRRKRGLGKSPHPGSRSSSVPEILTTIASLVEIVEETIASVVSGYAVKTQRAEQKSTRKRTSPENASDAKDLDVREPQAPTVILNIEKPEQWLSHINSGAWRRIVMNLVGNALKYTSTGHVVARLSTTSSRSKSGRETSRIVFVITDSGQGMSKTYQKRSLFTPFTQEDQLSVGAGLGLSIVHRLVTELDGEIKIDSEVDVGTNVRVVIPQSVVAISEDVPKPVAENQISAARNSFNSQDRVCFLGFDLLPAIESTPTGTMSALALGLMKLKKSLVTMSYEWFGLQATSDTEAVTICMVEASYARMLLKQDPTNSIFTKRYIVVSAYDETKIADHAWPGNYNSVTTPIGPIKLARTLIQATRHHDVQTDGTPATTKPPTPNAQLTVEEATRTVSRATPQQSPKALPYMVASVEHKPRVLLVDDNDINTRVLATLVRKLGSPFATARNGQEALEEFITAYEEGEPFQYVFMDISMPIMDGLTSTRRIRAYESGKHKYPRAQIFALTGLGNTDTQNEATASGVDQYYRKPVRLDTLRRAITMPNDSSEQLQGPSKE